MKFDCAYDELVPVGKLVPNPKNSNIHGPEQVDRLAKIIAFQGQRSPIVVSKRSGFIVKGHGRLLAMEKLGWEQVAVDYQDYESEAQEYADMTADNAIAAWSSLDLSAINKDILELGPELDIDLLGIKNFTVEPMETLEIDEEIRDDLNKKFILEIKFPNDMEMMDIHDDLASRGYLVKVK